MCQSIASGTKRKERGMDDLISRQAAIDALFDEIGPEVLSEYCPHCGAHMENWEE